jgi:hypothetical protein
MTEIKFNCPNCQQPLEATAEYFGQDIDCPSCNKSLKVPSLVPPPITPHKRLINTAIPPPNKTPSASPPRETGNIKHFFISALRWLLFIPIGVVVTYYSTAIVYWVAAFIDSFMPEELSGLIATRASLVVVLPLIAAVTVGASYIAPMPKTGAVLYGLCFAMLRILNIMYAGESVIFALIYYAPVVYGVYSVLKDKKESISEEATAGADS